MDDADYYDFEIEEDLPIDEKVLQMFNEFESCEVDVFDDFSAIELNEICNVDEEEHLEHLPELIFCDDAEIQQITVGVSKFEKSVFVCELCSRSYNRKSFLDKHVVFCGKHTKFYLFFSDKCHNSVVKI